MKKTLIALALAALPVASMADVVLYGQIKGGVEVGKIKGVSGTITQIVDYGSRIGFKGQENLKGDINAIWQLESQVNIGGGKNSEGDPSGFGTRDSFIGLQSDSLGTVKAGYQQTPVAEMNGDLDQWEYDNSAAGLGIFTRENSATQRRLAVSYETPVFNGFSAKAFVSPSDNNAGSFTANDTKKTKGAIGTDSAVYGLGLKYIQNPEADKMGWFGGLAATYVRGSDSNSYYSSKPPFNPDAKKYGYQATAELGYEGQQWFAGLAYQHSENVDKGDPTGLRNLKHPDRVYQTKSEEIATSVAYSPNEAWTLKASAVMGWGVKGFISGVNGVKIPVIVNGKTIYVNVPATPQKLAGNGKYYQAIVGADYNISKRTTLNGQLGYLQVGHLSKNQRGGILSAGMKHRF